MRDLLLLTRAPLAATAAANGALGVLVAWPAGREGPPSLAVALAFGLASACLYAAGMALNDWFDLARDRELYPNRPLPSGRVQPRTGALIGAGLLGTGVLLAAAFGAAFGGSAARGLMAGGAVAGSVLAYDGLLKRWRLPGALAMGACRTTNALLGPIALGLWSPLAPDGPGSGALAYALLVGAYVVGLTWVSTFEDRSPDAAEQAGAFSATAGAPLAALLLSLLSGGWSPLGAVGWLPLARVVWGQAWAAALGDAGAHGRTVALLKGLWLLDLGLAAAALSGGALASGLVVLGCLFAGGKLAAARLWGKPPGPAPAGAPAGGGT